MRSRKRSARPPVLPCVATILLALLQSVAPAEATIYTWNVAGGGLTNTSVNWSPAGVPGVNDDTRFWQSSVTYTVTTASPADTFATLSASSTGHPQFSCVDPLRVRNTFSVDGGVTASVIGGFARAGAFSVGAGTLTITGNGVQAAATNPAGSTYFGSNPGFNATVNIGAGAGFSAPRVYVPEFTGTLGTLNIAGHVIGGNNSFMHVIQVAGGNQSGNLYVGNQGTGDVELSNGGYLTVDTDLSLGSYATGRLHMFRNSTLTPLPIVTAYHMDIGWNNVTGSGGGQGTFAIDQGIANLQHMFIGDDDGGGSDTLRMTGGSLTVPSGLVMSPTKTGILDLRGGTFTLGAGFYSVVLQQAPTLNVSNTFNLYAGYSGGGFGLPVSTLTTTSGLSMGVGRSGPGTFNVIGDGLYLDREFDMSGGLIVADNTAGMGTVSVDTAAVCSVGGGMQLGPGSATMRVRRMAGLAVSGEADLIGGAATGPSFVVSDSMSEADFRNGLCVGGTSASAIPGAASFTADSSAVAHVIGALRVWKGGGSLSLLNRANAYADSVLCTGSVALAGASLLTTTNNAMAHPVRGPARVSNTGTIHGTGVLQGRIQLADSTATIAILSTDPAGGTLTVGDTLADGFTSSGTLDIQQDTLVIVNRGRVDLGHVRMEGGTLRIPQGGHLRAQDLLEGTAGRLEGDILDDGVIQPAGVLDVGGHVTCLIGAIAGSFLNVLPGAELSVKGAQSGTLRNGGQLDMGPAPALLTLTATPTFLATSRLTMRIGSKASQVQDTLALTHPVTLNGTLDLRTWKPAPPQAGDTLTLITAPSITGTFATVTIDSVDAPSFVQPLYSPTSVKVAILRSTAAVPHAPPAPVVALRFAALGPPVAPALELDLPADADVQVSLYDVVGRRVMTLAAGVLAAGRHRFALPVAELASGVYFARAQVAGSAGARVLGARVLRLR